MICDRAVRGLCLGVVLAGGAIGAGAAVPPADTFAARMNTAMARMDHDMMTAPSGSVDRDFATMMIPHHQGAIDMAEAELRFGHDPGLRRLAEAIVAAQRKEIAVMRQALARLPAASMPAQGGMPMPGPAAR